MEFGGLTKMLLYFGDDGVIVFSPLWCAFDGFRNGVAL